MHLALLSAMQNPSASLRTFSQRGFSLLEVLVSIIILSFGLLGMVGLQAAAIQANREAKIQSSASILARELAELMRGNPAVALTAGPSNPYLITTTTSPMAPNTANYCLNVGSSACSTNTNLADAQMTEWLSRVDSELPGAKVVVCPDSAPFDANGLPRWACSTSGTGITNVIKIGWTRGSTDRSAGIGSNTNSPLDRATIPGIVVPITASNKP